MATNLFAEWSHGPDNTYFATIEQTGPDTATMILKKWSTPQIGRLPSQDSTYYLTGITATGDTITCRTQQAIEEVDLTIAVSHDGEPPGVEISYSGFLLPMTTLFLPLAPAARDEALLFIRLANFPPAQ